jgi:rfaE bifunctional protein nucleotidyltransferase chain/domain
MIFQPDITPLTEKPVLSLAEAARLSTYYKETGKTIVFTNGVFDILHRGHADYLAKAKALGDVLIVAINSDTSVKKNKGDKRPINSEEDRAFMLKSLKAVDAVLVFDEPTPLTVISAILPDVLVKGADYRLDNIVGREAVEEHGGTVKTIPLVMGKSTTGIIERVLDAYRS